MIVAVVIESNFTIVSTFSIVMGVTTSVVKTISAGLTLTWCYGICCYNICFSICCFLCFCFSICFLDSPSVGVVLGGIKTSLAAHFQALTSKIKWISNASNVTKSIVMVAILVVSIVVIVIASTFIVVSTFSIVMGITLSSAITFLAYLTLTCCYGICY